MTKTEWLESMKAFLESQRPNAEGGLTAVSLFSGAGISDLGYELAGFRFVVQVELQKVRAQLGKDNFPHSKWIVGDVREATTDIVRQYRESTDRPLELLVATPPCQGMSSSNPSRGKRQSGRSAAQEAKNRLILEVVPVAKALKPKVIVAENVRPVLTLRVSGGVMEKRVIDLLEEGLRDYEVFEGVVNTADYGIPQARRRAVVVAIRKDQAWLQQLTEAKASPWPRRTHSDKGAGGLLSWINVQEWFKFMAYEPLDARSVETSQGTHPLHRVPHYEGDEYLRVRDIPPYSSKSAYQNETCPTCGHSPVAEGLVICPACGMVMKNRPWVMDGGQPRLIKGFRSSYRRMYPERPAPTITTNSSHIGSDYKIHPWENRVLSTLECSDLQTVPRFFDWSHAFSTDRPYLIRNVVGEALPTYFAYLHGKAIRAGLSGEATGHLLEPADGKRVEASAAAT